MIWQTVLSWAASVPDNGGVYFVPAFAGLSAPYWSSDARAAIVGLIAHSTKAHVVRAALESIACQIYDTLTMMQNDAGVVLGAIQGDGGPTANPLLMQLTADLSGLELVVADVADVSPLGAILAGRLAVGNLRTLEDVPALPRRVVTYTPHMPEMVRGGGAECAALRPRTPKEWSMNKNVLTTFNLHRCCAWRRSL